MLPHSPLNNMKKTYFSLVVALVLYACSSKNEADPTAMAEVTGHAQIVRLTPDQVKNTDIIIMPLEPRVLNGTVKANGMLDVPPQNLVTISAPLGGVVKATTLLQGMKVAKGQIVAVMEHPDYIQLQQDFLDGKSQLEFLEVELQRQEELARENVNAAKALQQARSNFLSMKARVEGWRARLALLNIQPADLEKNGIQSTVNVHSPISGYVTQVHVNIGMFVNPNDVMFKIVDTEHLHAEIIIFEKDVSKVKIGQNIRLTLANESVERLADIYLVGKEIAEDRTVRVHGHLKKEDASLLPGMFFNAIIETATETVPTLPEAALVVFEGHDYVFVVRGDNEFEMVKVVSGLRENGYVEVDVPAELLQARFVGAGAYNLLGMLKNTGEEE